MFLNAALIFGYCERQLPARAALRTLEIHMFAIGTLSSWSRTIVPCAALAFPMIWAVSADLQVRRTSLKLFWI